MSQNVPYTEKLSNLSALKNKYFIMRHGESMANVEKKIVSDPRNGVDAFGLSDKGKEQASASVSNYSLIDSECVVVSSDFKRARETAEIVSVELGCEAAILINAGLRERSFGELELTDTSNYKKVWAFDREDARHNKFGVESVTDVLERVLGVVIFLEDSCKKRDILLVSHGDVLQIIQTAFEREPVSLHRNIDHLHTAEIRELRLNQK